jgi:hypothetical protein
MAPGSMAQAIMAATPSSVFACGPARSTVARYQATEAPVTMTPNSPDAMTAHAGLMVMRSAEGTSASGPERRNAPHANRALPLSPIIKRGPATRTTSIPSAASTHATTTAVADDFSWLETGALTLLTFFLESSS